MHKMQAFQGGSLPRTKPATSAVMEGVPSSATIDNAFSLPISIPQFIRGAEEIPGTETTNEVPPQLTANEVAFNLFRNSNVREGDSRSQHLDRYLAAARAEERHKISKTSTILRMTTWGPHPGYYIRDHSARHRSFHDTDMVDLSDAVSSLSFYSPGH